MTTFVYDTATKGIGQLASESSSNWMRSYFYDHLSRPVATVEIHGLYTFSVSRSYDVIGRPDTMTYPTGFATRQVYTVNGHLSEVQNAADGQLYYWRALAVNARGQITQETQGNDVVTDRAFDANTGLIAGITATRGTAGDVQKLEFDFDLIGNLTVRRDKRFNTTFSETFGYDTLNRLKTVATTGASTVAAAYDDLGNITSRSDVGSFSYGAGSNGPHALTGVTGGAFNKTCGYDSKGNRIADGATILTYSSFNKPVRMVKGGDILRFDHGADRSVFRQTTALTLPNQGLTHTVRDYVGGLYERELASEGLVRHIHYIAGGSGVTAILTDERSAATGTQRTRFIHKDHLGSVDAITDSAGAVVERQSFDAWGRRRTLAYNSGSWTVTYPDPATPVPASTETHRGFTGHEMLDVMALVHMGGRIYDPITARFLSPDPFVQSPDNLQNLNRYSYVLNNPLSFTDPSGFFWKSIAKVFQKIAGPLRIVATVLFFIPGCQAIAIGMQGAISFGSAFSGSLLAGGSVGDAFRAGFKAGAIALTTQAATAGVGGLYEAGQISFAARLAAHGVINGASSAAQGGKFKHGFLSGSFSAAFSPISSQMGTVGGTIASAVVGGTAESLGGGKFANGAVTGAMVHVLNDLNHSESIPIETSASTDGKIAVVGGFFDDTLNALGYNSPGRDLESFLRSKGYDVEYFTWDEGSRLGNWIDKGNGSALVIGHSYGGDTAASVIAGGHRVRYLVTADPVSMFRPSLEAVSANSGMWFNINAQGGGSANWVAGLGRSWDNAPSGYATLHRIDFRHGHESLRGMLGITK